MQLPRRVDSDAAIFPGVAILLAVAVVPVMIAARNVGAHETRFGSAVFAVLLQMILGAGVLQVRASLCSPITVVVEGALIHAFALDTTIPRGFIVSLLAGLSTAAIALLTLGSLLTGRAVIGTPGISRERRPFDPTW